MTVLVIAGMVLFTGLGLYLLFGGLFMAYFTMSIGGIGAEMAYVVSAVMVTVGVALLWTTWYLSPFQITLQSVGG